MKRSLTLAGIALVAGLSFALYSLKYQVQELERRYETLTRATAAEREALRVLRAEWSYLNSPQRLASLATKHLELAPADNRKFGSIADVERGKHIVIEEPQVEPGEAAATELSVGEGPIVEAVTPATPASAGTP